MAARYLPSIKHNHNNIHQNFPLITFTVKDSILTMSQQHFGPTSINSATGLHLLLLSVLLAFFHKYCTDISVRPKPTLLDGRVLLYLRYFLCGPLSYRACVYVLIDVCVQLLLYMFSGQHKIILQHSRSKSSTKPPSPIMTCQFKMDSSALVLTSSHPIGYSAIHTL